MIGSDANAVEFRQDAQTPGTVSLFGRVERMRELLVEARCTFRLSVLGVLREYLGDWEENAVAKFADSDCRSRNDRNGNGLIADASWWRWRRVK